MKRTTVKLPEDLDAQLRAEAERRNTTVSALTRQAIDAFLNGGPRDARFPFIGMFRSGGANMGSRVDEILENEVIPALVAEHESFSTRDR
jgi:hypothetical protein